MNKIYVDFNNCDSNGRVRLNTRGTFDDLERLSINLRPGLELLLDDDEELVAKGVVQFSEEENIWVATITWIK